MLRIKSLFYLTNIVGYFTTFFQHACSHLLSEKFYISILTGSDKMIWAK
jgi:hypothetical protein